MTRPSTPSEYLASIGSKGGQVKGKSKRRGGSDYYQELSRKAAKARKAKREERK